MKEIAIKFKDLERKDNNWRTAASHMDICKEKGAVIWGAWTSSNAKMTEQRMKELNEEPFIIWALDKKSCLIKMVCERALTKEEVVNKHLEYLIPSYYGLDEPCAVYYLIREMSITKVENSQYIFTTSGNTLYNSNQIASNRPWNVKSEKFPLIG